MALRNSPDAFAGPAHRGSSPRLPHNTAGGLRSGVVATRSMTLAYHEIVPEASRYLYTASMNQFDEHLRMISELSAGLQPRIQAPEITFDDGHISNYSYALPVLEKNARRAIFFVTVPSTTIRSDCRNDPNGRTPNLSKSCRAPLAAPNSALQQAVVMLTGHMEYNRPQLMIPLMGVSSTIFLTSELSFPTHTLSPPTSISNGSSSWEAGFWVDMDPCSPSSFLSSYLFTFSGRVLCVSNRGLFCWKIRPLARLYDGDGSQPL